MHVFRKKSQISETISVPYKDYQNFLCIGRKRLVKFKEQWIPNMYNLLFKEQELLGALILF